MKSIFTVVGARPQFVKAGIVSHRMKDSDDLHETIIHTGQHYDTNMSNVFFDQLGIPEPKYNLGIGSGGHGEQTGAMLQQLEEIFKEEKPDIVLVYGDTNSTLAAALAAVKLHIPIAHVEAGLRSFNKKMPEEINRIMTDHASTWLFCPTSAAVKNLAEERIVGGVHNIGDVMYDAYLFFFKQAMSASTIMQHLGIAENSTVEQYFLLTIHRPENTNHQNRMKSIFSAASSIEGKVIFPIHPRTRSYIKEHGISLSPNIHLIDPISYADMCLLQKHAAVILTDSGGIQKEAYFARVPCITLRDETEWGETVESGWNRIVGADENKITDALEAFSQSKPAESPNAYGDGNAARKLVEILSKEPSV